MTKKTQFGRSMIEMLGVLAIVGVLSIGGLAGFRKAMINHKANDAIAFVHECSVAETAANIALGYRNSGVVVYCSERVGRETPFEYYDTRPSCFYSSEHGTACEIFIKIDPIGIAVASRLNLEISESMKEDMNSIIAEEGSLDDYDFYFHVLNGKWELLNIY